LQAKKALFMDKLKNYRNRIDKIDSKLIVLLRKRESIINKIGLLKAQKDQSVQNKQRENEIFSRLDTDFEKETFKTILKESKRIQRLKH